MIKLTKRISPIPLEGPPKPDGIADWVVRQNPKVYEGKHDSVELGEWTRRIEKIFAELEVPRGNKLNIRTFYFTGKADIWLNTIRHKWQETELTWVKFFFEKLRPQFFPITIQR